LHAFLPPFPPLKPSALKGSRWGTFECFGLFR
jgi:hypothetical protein